MKSLFQFIRMTLVGGILFLVPIVVLMIILTKAFGLIRKVVNPVATHLPFHSILGLSAPAPIAILALILLCFFAGVVSRSLFAQHVVEKLEGSVLSNLPGYLFLKNIGESTLGAPPQKTYDTVLAWVEESWQLAFSVEQLDSGVLAVFIPGAPDAQSGSVYFLTPERIRKTNVHSLAAVQCLRRLGAGSNELLRGVPMGPPAGTSANA